MIVTPLRRIEHPKGCIYHAMKATDAGFAGFGEAYFTTVIQGETKGWKQHTRMQMNLVVPVGEVAFHLRASDEGETIRHVAGDSRYVRLTVPAGYWVAFTGLGQGLNLVLNLASLAHDPEEAINLPIEAFPLAKGDA
ncbi:dTDP-4-dehydrorhamnose 3,5-epimerase [Roseateles sp.]|uniref:dTDP-4-dehydrorhamnose 3,5-epimerase n=1 Tax=Roseateles sp. TaxID=1971397 RepID=UPI003BA5C9C6